MSEVKGVIEGRAYYYTEESGFRFVDPPKPKKGDSMFLLTPEKYQRLRTIERAALALLKNKRDLGLIQLREDLIEDLRKAVES